MMKWMSAILLVLILVLAACSGAGPQTSTEPEADAAEPTEAAATEAPAPDEETEAEPTPEEEAAAESGDGEAVTLRYAIWSGAQQPTMEELAARFEEMHPNVDVVVELTPNDQYWTKMDAAATGGSMPDVFWMHASNFVKYASNGMIIPITEQVNEAGVDLSQYPEQLVDLYTYEGDVYGLPRNYNLIGLWYNKELFDAAGVEYPTEEWDWEQFRTAAEQLTNEEEGVWGFASTLENQTGYWNVIYQNGGYVISEDQTESGFDEEATIEALEYWTSFAEDGISPSYQQLTETGAQDLFSSGKLAMMFGGDWIAADFANNEYTVDRVDVAPLPQGEQRAVILHGSSNAISAQSEHPEEAWEFVKFLGGLEAAEIQSRGGASGPPAYLGAADFWVETKPMFNLGVFVDQVPYGVLYPHSVNTNAWIASQNEVLAQAWAGEITVEEAAQQVAEEMDAILAEE